MQQEDIVTRGNWRSPKQSPKLGGGGCYWELEGTSIVPSPPPWSLILRSLLVDPLPQFHIAHLEILCYRGVRAI